MRMFTLLTMVSLGLLSLGVASAPSECQAAIMFQVDLNTTPLIGHPAAPFAINFQLNDGSGTNDGNNTATIQGFSFGGGGPVGSPILTGGASGDLSTGVTLTDSSFFNDFVQDFTVGTFLSFTVQLTTNVDAGAFPDLFSFALLDGTGAEVPTLSPLGGFLVVEITGPGTTVQTYGSDPIEPVGGSGPPVSMDPPQITLSDIPEPSTGLIFSLGMLLLLPGRRLLPVLPLAIRWRA